MILNTAGGSNYLDDQTIKKQLEGILETGNYQKAIKQIQETGRPSKTDNYYSSNFDYWNGIFCREIHPGFRIQLNGFHVLEWLPVYPGLVHQEESQNYLKNTIKNANKRIVNDIIEYDPGGKAAFVKAGFGSIRFATKIIRGREYFLLSASSSGVSHEGIPMIVEKPIYKKLIPEIKKGFGVFADLIGEIIVVPNSENSILNWQRIPSYYFLLEKAFVKRPSLEGETTISIAATYRSTNEEVWRSKWTFIQFYPDSVDKNLFESVDWIKNYPIRYGETNEVVFSGEFDELIPHFAKSDFELTKTSNGIFSTEKASKYLDRYELQPTDELTREDVFVVRKSLKEQINSHLSRGEIKACIEFVELSSSNEKVLNYLISLKSRLAKIEDSKRKSTITIEQYNVFRNRITDSLLSTFISTET